MYMYKVGSEPNSRIVLCHHFSLNLNIVKFIICRNEVWRYQLSGALGESTASTMFKSVFRGFPVAVGISLAFIVAETVYHKAYPPKHGGHH